MIPVRRPASGRFHPELLFRPRVIAVVGEGAARVAALANLRQAGFPGTVLTARDPDGIAGLETAPDLALLAAPGPVMPALTALAARGCRAAIALDAADDIAQAAAATGVRVLGPYSYGLSVPGLRLDASLGHLPVPPGRLAVVSQSTALCRALLDWAGPNGVGFSHIVGLGGNADLGFGAVLDWLSHDPGTGAVLLDMRRIKSRRAFLSAARAAARLRPVLALRPGGRLLDPSGEADAAMAAALRRAGILSVATLEDLLAAAETITAARPARGPRPIIVTNGVGPGRLAADAAMRDGLALASLDPAAAASLAAILGVVPPDGAYGVIHVAPDQPTRLAEVASALAALPGVGGILVVHAPTGPADATAIAALAACHATIGLPLLVCAMGETSGAAHRARLAEAGVPAFATPEQAVRGFLHLEHHRATRAAARELPPSDVLALAPDRPDVARVLREADARGVAALPAEPALAILAAYGLPVVPGRVARGAGEAAEAARLLGFPAQLRPGGPPSPASRRARDLTDAADVAAAAQVMLRGGGNEGEGAPAGVLVQRQPPTGPRLRLRVGDDPMFGTVLRLGTATGDAAWGVAGGAAGGAEAIDLLPLNLPLARALLGRLASGGGPVTSRGEALAEALVRVSQLIVDFPAIAALDITDLAADGQGVAVVEAAVTLRPPGDRASRLAIAPYPAELEERWVPRDAPPLLIRPIRPEDAEAHGAFFARLSAEDVRYRFFTAVRQLSSDMMVRLTQVDYDREMAFVAIRPAPAADRAGGEAPDEETVGVARLVCEADCRSGEFAVIVQPDMKGRGLASHLMHRLFDWARARGIAEIVGQVLADNAPMLAFVRGLGFSVHRMEGEEDVMEVRLALRPPGADA